MPVICRPIATVTVRPQPPHPPPASAQRMALGKLQFRRNFDLMLQEMEATLLVLEVKRRTRLVTLEDKEWSAMQVHPAPTCLPHPPLLLPWYNPIPTKGLDWIGLTPIH